MRVFAYFGFLAGFAVNPRAALEPYYGLHAVDPSLALFALIGSVIGAAILAISVRTGIVDPDRVEDLSGPFLPHVISGRWSWIAWPAASAVVILGVTAVVHGFAAGWHVVRTAMGIGLFDDALGGTWRDTVNALLAANALLSPLFAIVVTASQQFEKQYETASTLPFVLAMFGYPTVALSATHPDTGFWQALGVLFAPISVPLLIVLWLGWILRTLSGLLSSVRRQR
jgi:hypothetical protein